MVWLTAALGFLKRVPGWAWIALAAGVALWFYGNARYDAGVDHERGKWEAKVAELERKVIEAEREAQANHEVRETTRTTTTTVLRKRAKEAADANPEEASREVGPATRAVLDGLRQSRTGS